MEVFSLQVILSRCGKIPYELRNQKEWDTDKNKSEYQSDDDSEESYKDDSEESYNDDDNN